MLKITYSDRFIKHYRKLTDVEKRQLKSKLSMFADDPFHPSLRTIRIQGTDALFEFSVNMDIRVIWFFDGEDVVILLDVGHHDILREY